MTRFAACTLLLALCALLGACPESMNPVSAVATARPDPRLFGTWSAIMEGDRVSLRVWSSEAGLTNALLTEHQEGGRTKSDLYEAFPSRVGDLEVVNVKELDGKDHGWSVLKYEVSERELTLWMTDFDAVRGDIKAGKLKGIAEEGALGETRITASSAQLAAYLAAADPKRLFRKPLVFQKDAPPAPSREKKNWISAGL